MAENLNIPLLGNSDEQKALHLYRYNFALKFAQGRIIDAACGYGYGSDILAEVGWVTGFDRDVVALASARSNYPGSMFIECDLETYELPAADTAVSFETVEHLKDPKRFAEQLTKSKTIVLSTPIIPTKHTNEFHLQDFTKESVLDLFPGMALVYYEPQQEGGRDVYGIFVFQHAG